MFYLYALSKREAILRIAHIMLAVGPESEERYGEMVQGLLVQGHDTSAITRPKAPINALLRTLPISHLALQASLGIHDKSAASRLGPLVRTLRPHIVICYDALALTLARKALGNDLPIVAAPSGMPCEWAAQADAAFVPSEALMALLVEVGMPLECLYHVPPMIDQRGGFIRPVWRQPPTIFVQAPQEETRGLRLFLQALALVAERSIECRAVIMGEGVRLLPVKFRAHSLGVLSRLNFIAPHEMPAEMLHKMDLFCYPAQLASGGRALLPAMASKLPIVTTDAIGPSGMLQHKEEAWIVPVGDAPALAEGLAILLEDEDLARTMASNAFHRLKRHHVRERVCQMVSGLLADVAERHAYEKNGASGEWPAVA